MNFGVIFSLVNSEEPYDWIALLKYSHVITVDTMRTFVTPSWGVKFKGLILAW